MGLQINRVLGPGDVHTGTYPDQGYIFGDSIAAVTFGGSIYNIDLEKIGGFVGLGGATNVENISGGGIGIYNTNSLHNGQPVTINPNNIAVFGDSYTAVANDDFVVGYGLVELTETGGTTIVDLSVAKGHISVNTGTVIKPLSSDALVISGQMQIASAAADNHSITSVLEPGDSHTIRTGGGSILYAEGSIVIDDNAASNPNSAKFDVQQSNFEFPIILVAGAEVEVFGGTVAYYDTTA